MRGYEYAVQSHMDFEAWLLASLSWEGVKWTAPEFLQKIISGCTWRSQLDDLKTSEPAHIWFEKRQKVFTQSLERGVQWVLVGDVDYPRQLLTAEYPPLLLSYIGSVKSLNLYPTVSVVGSRNFTHESGLWMEEHLQGFIRKQKICTVSGGARGVDQRAHQISIRMGLPTVAWLPSGIHKIYPSSLENWVDDITATGGAVVSGFPPDQEMFKWQFHVRNKWIAACSSLLIVVEARRRSGSLVTAGYAREMGCGIAVVPCSPNTLSGLGGLDLIYDGAQLVRDAKDLQIYHSGLSV